MIALSNISQKFFFIFLIYNLYFYHLFKSLNITLFFTFFCFFLILSIPYIISIIKKNEKIYFNNIEKIILTIFFVIFIYIFKNCIDVYFSNNKDLIKHISKNTISIGVFYNFALLLSFLFFYFIFKKTNINLENIFFISSVICFILLTASFVFLMFADISSHKGWLNPHLYLFFFNDNVSSKLQHAYILFIITSPFIFQFYFNDRRRNKLIFIFSFFYFFLINSKLFFLLFLFYNFLLLIFFFNKKNIFNLFKMSLISIFLIIFSLNTISLLTKKEFSLFDSLLLKYSKIFNMINISVDYEKILNKESYKDVMSNLKSRDEFKFAKKQIIINYFDSTNDRMNKIIFCLSDEGKKKKILKNYSTILIDDKFIGGPYSEKFFQIKNKQKYFNVNCEGSVFQSYYVYEKKIFFLIFLIFFIFLYLYKKKDLFSLIMFFLIILLSLQHLTLDNSITYVFLSVLLTNKSFFFKKIS